MFRTPIPNAKTASLENCGTEQLLGLFESCLKGGWRGVDYGLLSDAWGHLFSGMYLSAEELVNEMHAGKHRLDEEWERMLREFIKADCARGGAFTLSVIRKGGNIDRAALIMIADPEDIAGIELKGTTAIHLLAGTCDRKVRPALIRKAGNRLLSVLFDSRGIPAIFTIFSLGDVCISDLDALAEVFTPDELRGIMSQNRSGRNALEVFSEISMVLKSRPSLERNTFFKTNARKDSNLEENTGMQVSTPAKHEKISKAKEMQSR
jgi:hypothetical protein